MATSVAGFGLGLAEGGLYAVPPPDTRLPRADLGRTPFHVSPRRLTRTVPAVAKRPEMAGEVVRFVGMAGFEPAASCSQSRRATKLRHIPCSRP